MAPPQLTADTPVLDILQPVVVSCLVFWWVEFKLIVHYWRKSDVCKVLHLKEPLHTKTWFNCSVRVSLRVSYLVLVVLHFLHKACCLKVLHNLFAYCHTVHAHIHSSSLAKCGVCVEDVYSLKIVCFAQHVVICVVCRGYFQTSCTKLNLNISVLNYRNGSVYKWYNNLLAF